jgi:hypothetical protein
MCTVCNHPSRLEIERDLLTCPSVAAVAACHHLPLEEARQHKARLQARVEQAQRQLEQFRLADSLARLNLLLEKTMQVLAAAEENGDRKLMLQAIKEAGRLTKMLHALSLDQEAGSLFCEAGNPSWTHDGSTMAVQQQAREEVRQAIQRSLRTPCTGSNLEDELAPEPARLPENPGPAVRKGRASRRPPAAVIPWPSASEAALMPPDSPSAAQSSRTAPG